MARAKYAEWLTEQGLERLAEMAPRLTDAEMAKEMGISPSTYYDWLKKHSEMSEAVTRARTGADARANNESVERSLLETAPRRCPDAQKPMKLKSTSYDSRGRQCQKRRKSYTRRGDLHQARRQGANLLAHEQRTRTLAEQGRGRTPAGLE